MYIIYRKNYYKLCFCSGIVWCIICSIPIYYLIVVCDDSWNFFMIINLFVSITYTLHFLIKYFRKDLDFVALRIDDRGILLCRKKNEEVFVPWEKIKYVIFLLDDYGSKVMVRQHNKETHELLLRDYYNCFRPRGAINAAYKYTDDIEKIREVKNTLALTYDIIMWDLSEQEKKTRKKEQERTKKNLRKRGAV